MAPETEKRCEAKMSSSIIKFPFLDGLQTAPNHRKEDVEHIRDWLDHMPHLPKISDEHIHLFLHSNYSQLEKTKKTIDSYYTIKGLAPHIFSNLDPFQPGLVNISKVVECARAAGRTPEGYTVWINRLADTDPGKFDFISVLKGFFMMGDVMISEDGLSPGYVTVFDLKGAVLSHLATVSISAVKICMQFIQEGVPVRMRNIHVVNAVPFMDKVMALVKPFMEPELMALLHIHKSSDVLSEMFPPEALPSDYGGTGESMAVLHAKGRKMLETKYLPFMEKWTSLKVDESKRPAKTPAGGKNFGVEGSFRSLSID